LLTLLIRIICLSTFLRSIRKSLVHFYVYLSPSVQSQSEGCLWRLRLSPKKFQSATLNAQTSVLARASILCMVGSRGLGKLRGSRRVGACSSAPREAAPTDDDYPGVVIED